MNGLDRIIERIQSESSQECDEIIEKAQAQCENIRLQHEQQAAELTAQIHAGVNDELVKIQETAKLQAETDAKKMLFSVRQKMVAEAVAQAIEKSQNLPETEYFSVLTKLLIIYSQNRAGEIMLCPADFKRMTPEFREVLGGLPLELIQDNSVAGGGFILRYGEVEENCTFPALFAAKREIIHDQVYHILFG